MKNIKVEDKIWQKLQIIRINKKLRSINEVIKGLLK